MNLGQVTYASLAQLSVTGAADQQVKDRAIGQLDIFSSAFWTNPSFAVSMCRLKDDSTQIYYSQTGGRTQTKIFSPPRSMDVLFNMYVVMDLPGLIETVSYTLVEDNIAVTQTQELLNYSGIDGMWKNGYIVGERLISGHSSAERQSKTRSADTSQTIPDEEIQYLINNTQGDREAAEYAKSAFIVEGKDDNYYTYVNGGTIFDENSGNATIPEGKCRWIEVFPEGFGPLTGCAKYFSYRADGSVARYQNRVAQLMVDEVQMTVGGQPLDTITSMWMYIHEEIHGIPGRRKFEQIGGVKNFDATERSGTTQPTKDITCDLENQSQIHRRLYCQIPFFWCGGKLDRALKIIGMQNHRTEFKVTTKDLGDCIYSPDTATKCFHIRLTESNSDNKNKYVPAQAINPGSNYVNWIGPDSRGVSPTEKFDITVGDEKRSRYGTEVVSLTKSVNDEGSISFSKGVPQIVFKVQARAGELVQTGAGRQNMEEVRQRASGDPQGDLIRLGNNSPTNRDLSSAEGAAYFTTDFHGVFLNTEKRNEYLNLDEQILFEQTLTDSDITSSTGATRTKTLTFQNAVYEISAAVVNENEEAKDGWGIGGTDPDPVTGMRDDMLQTMEFTLAATPRTQPKLEGQFYRHVTQYMTADTMSKKKGLYFWPLYDKKELNNIRLVSGYINCSKVDDLKLKHKPTGDASAKNQNIQLFAKSYNLLHIKNGLVGKLFQ